MDVSSRGPKHCAFERTPGRTMREIWRASSKMTQEELQATSDSYWGAATATLDWCEENYVITRYIAEFYNSISNAGMLALGAYGAYRSWKLGLDWRYVVGFLSIAVVGMGSFSYHATLLSQAQLFDELPMLWASGTYAYITSPVKWRRDEATRFKLAATVTALIAGSSVFYVWNRNPLFFESCFGVFVSIVTFRCIQMSRAKADFPGAKNARRLLKIGSLGFFFGFGLWVFENTFCDVLRDARAFVGPTFAPLLQFHLWWHVGSTVGGYALGVFAPAVADQDLDGEEKDEVVPSSSTNPSKKKSTGKQQQQQMVVVVDWTSVVPTNALLVDLEAGKRR